MISRKFIPSTIRIKMKHNLQQENKSLNILRDNSNPIESKITFPQINKQKFYNRLNSCRQQIEHMDMIRQQSQLNKQNHSSFQNRLMERIYQKQINTEKYLNKINDNIEKLVKIMMQKWNSQVNYSNPQKKQLSVRIQKIQESYQQDEQNSIQQKQICTQKWSQEQNYRQKENFEQRKGKKYSQVDVNNYLSQFQSRLKNIDIKLPPHNSSKSQVLKWVGKVCKRVLSVGFSLYKGSELDINKAKSFCSENILRNLLRLPKKIKQQYWSDIDNCLKTELFPYYRFNYPQTEQKGMSTKFSNLLIQTDTLNENDHDMFLKSGFDFKLEQDENYNSQIMKFLNFIISLPNRLSGLRQNKNNDTFTLRKLFQKDIEKIFQFIEDQQQVLAMESFNPKIPQTRKLSNEDVLNYINNQFIIINHEQDQNQNQGTNQEMKPRDEQNDILNKYEKCQSQRSQKAKQKKLKLGLDQKRIIKVTQNSQKNVNQNQKQISKSRIYQQDKILNQSLKYKDKVKSYTSQQIGQKLPENLTLFSQYQIQSGNLKLSNSPLMRVITKWCSQLERCFNPNEILNRENPWSMKDGSEKYMKKQQMIVLNQLLQRQKENITTKLKQIKKNNYQNQVQFSEREVRQQLKKFSTQEAIVGQFCSSTFKINETYLIKYLNMLIHGINLALVDFERLQRCNRESPMFSRFVNQNSPDNRQLLNSMLNSLKAALIKLDDHRQAISEVPNLIGFKIGDLLRCKCTSKQSEVITIYKLVEYLSQTKPQFMKIIKVRNKLDQGNKDILINILYRQSMVVEMQLAIKSEKSQFIQCSNKFNHYFYELQRSQFGPIMEMCSIWMSQDQRSKFYLNKIESSNKRIRVAKPEKCCLMLKNLQLVTLPFKCQMCSYDYYQCNFYQKHSKCKECNSLVCCLCRFEQLDVMQKQEIFPILKTDKKLLKQNLKLCDTFPIFGGKLLNINSKTKKIISFKPLFYNNQYYLFTYNTNQKNNKLQLIQKYKLRVHEQKQEEQKQFQDWFNNFSTSNLIFHSSEVQQQYKKLTVQEAQKKYFMIKNLELVKKSEKESIALIKKHLSLDTFKSIKGSIKTIDKLNFSQNKLTDLKILSQKFPNTKIAALTNNNFKSLTKKNIKRWGNSLTHLYLNQNKIDDIHGLKQLKKIVQVNFSTNNIKNIPQQVFTQLTSLKVLNIQKNSLKQIPKSIQKLSSLRILILSKNQIKQLPVQICNICKLTQLQINNNILTQLPKQFDKLHNLTTLGISNNQLTFLAQNFGNLHSLTYFNVNCNKLKELPSSFGDLCCLQQFDMSYNAIIKLPDSFCQLSKLNVLDISGNKITQLPNQFGNLSNLTKLQANSNKLTQIPTSFGDLTCLSILSLNQNQLTELPVQFGKLQNLKQLSISMNNIHQLPRQFGNLTNLIILHLQNNKLTTLPEQFGKLTKIKNLHLEHNYLTELPKQFSNIQSLKKLHIDNNKLSALPTQITYLKNLTRLLLSSNNLQNLPDQLNQCTSLKQLNISNNQLKQLPSSLGKLNNLSKLDVSYNQLITVPKQFCMLQKLVQLSLWGNGLEYLPIEFCKLTKLKQLTISLKNISQVGQFTIRNLLDYISSLQQLSQLKISLPHPHNMIDILKNNQLQIKNLKLPISSQILKTLLEKAYNGHNTYKLQLQCDRINDQDFVHDLEYEYENAQKNENENEIQSESMHEKNIVL